MEIEFFVGDTVVTNYRNKPNIKGFIYNKCQRETKKYRRKPIKIHDFFLVRPHMFITNRFTIIGSYIYDGGGELNDGYYRKIKHCRLLLTEKIKC